MGTAIHSTRALCFQGKDWLVGIGVSLALHALVLVWLVGLDIPRFSGQERIVVTLAELITSAPDPQAVTEPETASASVPEPEPTPVQQRQSDFLDSEPEPQQVIAAEQISSAEDSLNPGAREIRNQALDVAGAQSPGGQATLGSSREAIKYAPAPRLPGTAGGLDGSGGRIAPSVEFWTDADGSTRGRHVTAWGQVFCTRQYQGGGLGSLQGPITTYVTGCGRERAQSLVSDSDDPWDIGGARRNREDQDDPPEPPDFRHNSGR